MKALENRAAESLKALLGQVPAVKLVSIEVEPPGPDRGIDIRAQLTHSDRRHVLVCQVKADGQPRHVRLALFQLRRAVARLPSDATPILAAPYLSPEARAMCLEQDVGYFDLEGNARLVFDGVFIERIVPGKPPVERRALKSLFKGKSAQVLRAMLRDPKHAWRVTELSRAAGVSLGHVSNVRTALLDREWALVGPDGMFLSEPDALLDAWREAYESPDGPRTRYYTTLHGSAFEEAVRTALRAETNSPPGANASIGNAVLASFSAAHWLAPYSRTGTHFLYADDAGLERLQVVLKLSPTAKGENVVVTVPKDVGLFRDTIQPAPGIVCTGPVQTYLDLCVAGERGREAADHLRRERLSWPK